MSTYLEQIQFKNDDIKLQYINADEHWIVTQAVDLIWTLYNHTTNKKIGSSKDLTKLFEKIPDYLIKGGD